MTLNHVICRVTGSRDRPPKVSVSDAPVYRAIAYSSDRQNGFVPFEVELVILGSQLDCCFLFPCATHAKMGDVISDVEVVSPSLYRGTVETTGARGLPLIIIFILT